MKNARQALIQIGFRDFLFSANRLTVKFSEPNPIPKS